MSNLFMRLSKMKKKILVVVIGVLCMNSEAALFKRSITATLPGVVAGLCCYAGLSYTERTSGSRKYRPIRTNVNMADIAWLLVAVSTGGFISKLVCDYFDPHAILQDLDAELKCVESNSIISKVEALQNKYLNLLQERKKEFLTVIGQSSSNSNTVEVCQKLCAKYRAQDIEKYAYFDGNRFRRKISSYRNSLNNLVRRLEKWNPKTDAKFTQKCTVAIEHARFLIKKLDGLNQFLINHQAMMIYNDSFRHVYPLSNNMDF